MIAHLNVPSLEKEDLLPSTLSKNIIEKTLIKELMSGYDNYQHLSYPTHQTLLH